MSLSDPSPAHLGPLDRLKRLFGAVGASLDAPHREAHRSPGRPRNAPAAPGDCGFVDHKGHPDTQHTVVRVDQATFARIRGLAARRDLSVSGAARLLIERGLAKGTPVRVPIGAGAEREEH